MSRAVVVPETIVVQVPFRIVKRGGRKEMVMPEGATKRATPDSTLVKALARAFRWKRMLESGEFETIGDLAAQEKIAPSYMTRVMRLTLLAPEIVESILDGKQKPEVTLLRALEPSPTWWHQHFDHFANGVRLQLEQLYGPQREIALMTRSKSC